MSHKIFKFNNGLHLIYEKSLNENKYSSINFAVEFGSIHEPENNKGCAHFIEHMCFKQNKNIKSSKILSETFDKLGVYTNAYTDKKLTNYTFTAPNKNLLKTIDLLTDMMYFTIFDKEEFKREYNVVLEENYRDEQDFSEKLNNSIDNFMYADSVYKMPIDNIKYHNKKLKCDELYKIYKQHYTPDKMVLSICSAFPYDDILNHCKNNVISKHKSSECIKYSLNLNLITQNDYKIITSTEKLTNVVYLAFAYRTCSYFNTDIYTLNILKHILTSGMSSRLFTNLREKHGLTYASDAECNYFEHSGDFVIKCETNYNKLFGKNNVLDIIVRIINELIENGITIDELNKVKGYMEGQSLISLNDNRYICEYNAVNFICNNLNHSIKKEFDEKYKNVTVTTVNNIIKKYFYKENLLVSIINKKKINENKIKPYIEKLLR